MSFGWSVVGFEPEGHAVARYRLGVGEARDNHVELTDVPTGSCDLSGFVPHNDSVHLLLAD